MSELTGTSDRRLTIASTAVLVVGLGQLALVAMNLLQSGRYLFQPQYLAWLPRAMAVPAAYLVGGWFLRRGRYWAMVMVAVLASSMLLQTLVLSYRVPRGYLVSSHYLVGLLVPLIGLAAALWSRPAFAFRPDLLAAERAAGRAMVLLRVAGGVLLLVALGSTVPAAYLLAEHARDGFAVAIAIFLFIIAAVAGAASVGMVVAVRRTYRFGRRPGVGGIVFVAIVAAAVMLLSRLMSGPFGWQAYAALVDLAVHGLFIWLLVDMVHARRVCHEPQSYGFAPIMAQPVQAAMPGERRA